MDLRRGGGKFWRAACVSLALASACPMAARGQGPDDVGGNVTVDLTGAAAGDSSSDPSGGPSSGEATSPMAATSTPLGVGWLGRVPERRRVIPALWRTHPFDQKFPHLAYTRGVGLQASGWLAGVFINSYDRLSIITGVERAWLQARAGGMALGAGYRAGLLTGYDERLASWADETPVLPFVGLLGWVQVQRVGIDAFYVYRAITLEGSVAF